MASPSTRARDPSAGLHLGQHHLAYLRGVAEGLPTALAAARYLGLDPRDGAVALRHAHQSVVDRVRTLARRQADPRWRLIGLNLRPGAGAGHADGQGSEPPSVDDWAEQQGLQDFSQAELLALHAEAFPPDRRALRNRRLRAMQLALLQQLAHTATRPALPHDRIDAWFVPTLGQALTASGLLLLSDLAARVQQGGRWWKDIPRVGAGKAGRVVRHLELLWPGSTVARRDDRLTQRGRLIAGWIEGPPPSPPLPPSPPRSTPPSVPSPSLSPLHSSPLPLPLPTTTGLTALAEAPHPPPRGAAGLGFTLTGAAHAGRDLHSDALAVRAWIRARAGSRATALVYRRELTRFLLFLDQRTLTLAGCTADDCLAYMALLQNVPAAWAGRRTASLGSDAWSPFAGPISHRSQQQATVVVASCLAWLVAARYLDGNPWLLVNRRSGDARGADALASRALTPAAWLAIGDALQALAPGQPAAERLLFLLQFLEATGLRAAELLGARLGDFRRLDGRLLLQVHGKGSHNRVIPVVGQAQRALARYLAGRGLASEVSANPPLLPLLASLSDTDRPLGYRALYGSMKVWLAKAIAASGLPWPDQVAAARASPHWLRHTCGTRALERGVPLDVVGQLLGHADPRTTARYTRAQLHRVADELDKAFG